MMGVNYLRGTPIEWDEGVKRLTPTGEGGLALVGPCPRCGDQIRKNLGHIRAPGVALSQRRRMTVRVVCNCTGAHPEAPGGVVGCGAEGGVELEF
jgi:hypothetical protein